MHRRLRCILLVTSCVTCLTLLLLYVSSAPHVQLFNVGEVFGKRAMPTMDVTGSDRPELVVNPIPGDDKLLTMTHAELQDFFHGYVTSPQILCKRVIRMGRLEDGGWELCDDPMYKPEPGKCLVYSYGINFDYSYDDDMAIYGCEVHAFDPSMKHVKPHLRNRNIFFHATGVGGANATIKVKEDLWQLYTIGSHRRMYHQSPGQRRLDVLKMDVEGYELASMTEALDTGSIDDVRQMALETHLSFGKTDPPKEMYIKYLGLYRRLYEKGFRIFTTHRNFIWSAFHSKINLGNSYVTCHEVHMVNINNKIDISNINNNGGYNNTNSNNNNDNNNNRGAIRTLDPVVERDWLIEQLKVENEEKTKLKTVNIR